MISYDFLCLCVHVKIDSRRVTAKTRWERKNGSHKLVPPMKGIWVSEMALLNVNVTFSNIFCTLDNLAPNMKKAVDPRKKQLMKTAAVFTQEWRKAHALKKGFVGRLAETFTNVTIFRVASRLLSPKSEKWLSYCLIHHFLLKRKKPKKILGETEVSIIFCKFFVTQESWNLNILYKYREYRNRGMKLNGIEIFSTFLRLFHTELLMQSIWQTTI